MTQSFDELFWNRFDTLNKDTDLAYNFGSESYNEGYKAGASSRQAEIDALQKRIDEALKYTSESPLKDVSRKAMLNFLDILKGESE